MTRKPITKFEESSENSESDANVRLDWKLDASSIERLILDTFPLPTAALEASRRDRQGVCKSRAEEAR